MKHSDSPFRNATYFRLFCAQVTSLVGTGFTSIALALLAYDLAGSRAGEVLGTVLAIKMATYVILSPIIGSFAHLLPRRLWLASLDIVRVFLVLSLILIREIWQIYLVLFLTNACSAGFTPVFQAAIPDIIKNENQYHKALSYSQLAYNLERIISPSLTAFLLVFTSLSGLFLIDGFTFLISALLVISCLIPPSKPAERSSSMLFNLQFGISSYLKTPRLRALWVLYFAVASASAMVIINTVVYVQDYLKGGETQTAIAFGITGLGSIIGALILPRLISLFKIRTLLFSGTILLVVALFAGVTMPSWAGFSILWFCLGVGLAVIQTPVGAIVRSSCRSSDSAAYFSANFSLSHLCWFGSYLLAGYIGSVFGLSISFLILGIISLSALLLAWWIYPNPDVEEIEHLHEQITHDHHHIHDKEHHDHAHSQPLDSDGHSHPHQHDTTKHTHSFFIDFHHQHWPST